MHWRPQARAACSTASGRVGRRRARSRTGRCSATGPTSTRAERSSRPSAPGRAVFEALGRGQDVSAEHVFAYAALRPAERREDGWWLTGRPDPDRDEADAQALVDACDGLEVDRLLFTLQHLWRGEAVLRIEGEADERITDTDAFFRDRHPVLRPQALVPEAERTARAAEEWTRWTMELLAEHEVTNRRAEDGLPVFNVMTLKWWGRPRSVPTF